MNFEPGHCFQEQITGSRRDQEITKVQGLCGGFCG